MPRVFIGGSLGKRLDRSPVVRELWWRVEAGAMGALWWLYGRLSPERASALGRGLVRRIGPFLDKHRRIKSNLAIAFPQRSAAIREDMARNIWGTAGAVLAEYPHLEAICAPGADARVDIVSSIDLETLTGSGRPHIFVSAHLANWEIPVAIGSQFGLELTTLYTPIQNPYIDRRLARMRAALGCRFLPRDQAMRGMIRCLGAGRSLGLIVDQQVDTGAPVPLFGHDKPTTLVPARLALRFSCDLIPVQVTRLAPARFRITVHPPVESDPGLASDHARAVAMMAEVNQLFADWITAQPTEWLCAKRRWPKALHQKIAGAA